MNKRRKQKERSNGVGFGELVGARRGLTLEEACAALVEDAKGEKDPFMRELLLATAAGGIAGSVFKRPNIRVS